MWGILWVGFAEVWIRDESEGIYLMADLCRKEREEWGVGALRVDVRAGRYLGERGGFCCIFLV